MGAFNGVGLGVAQACAGRLSVQAEQATHSVIADKSVIASNLTHHFHSPAQVLIFAAIFSRNLHTLR